MTLAHGHPYLAIPGPSVIPDPVLRAMMRPAPNIYDGELTEMVPGIVTDLAGIARTAGDVAIYIANGHGGWEAALANVLSPGDRVLVLATGRFAAGWGAVATGLGAEVTTLDFGSAAPADPERVAAALRDDPSIRAVLTVQADTATGVLSDVAAVAAARDRAGSDALVMVDAIASFACDRLEMDAWGVDVVVTGSQKGLMTPPGLTFVMFNARADAARDRAACATPYWDWRPRVRPKRFYEYFCGTAPTHHLYALRAALDMIAAEGMEAVWARHAALARAVWAAGAHWSGDGDANAAGGEGVGRVRINVPDPAARSHAVTAFRAAPGAGARLRSWTETQAGLTLGLGLGVGDPADPDATGVFRLGHMGHVSATMILGALATIEAGMVATDLPHVPGGTAAAAATLARV